MSVAIQNGRQQPVHRKQLSEQLDRFDEILDGLSEGLNGAMADAAREGTRLAVKDAIVEILSNPDLREVIGRPTESAPPKSTFWSRIKARVARAKASVVEAVTPEFNSSLGKSER